MNVRRQMTLDDRQRECLETCMGSCDNICYPTLGLIEEVGEYVEKLMKVVEFYDKDTEVAQKLNGLLCQFVLTAGYIGTLAKGVRHQQDIKEEDLPFRLCKFEDMEEVHDVMMPIWKELGDIDWMLRACEHFNGMTSQMIADINHEKLMKRKKDNTIDGRGDEERKQVD